MINFKYLLYFFGIKLKYSKNKKEVLSKIGKLRKQVFVERNYVEAKEVPDIWLDEYDQEAINFYASKKNNIIGIVRIIKKEAKLILPIEKYFNLLDIIPKNYVEISKLAVCAEHRGGKRLLFIGLMQQILKYCKKNNINHLVMFMPDWLFESMRKLGVNMYVLEHEALTKKEIDERHTMRKYFNKQTITPYIFKV
ncbi:MAG: GNAT family N-acyltransferase [Patescibacteria group bacterium]|nr:GNAT family N-acyltransferase [Patescibacteria group bacterium]